MAEGKIKKITEKGFGFIEKPNGKDLFFHSSSVQGTEFAQLCEGQSVLYDIEEGPRGQRAQNVRLISQR